MNPQRQQNNIYLNASYLLMFCIILLPLHTQIFYMALPIYTNFSKEIISIWKEVLFLFTMSTFLLNSLLHNDSIRILFIDTVIIFFLIFLVLLLFVSDDKIEAIYGFRVFIEPLLVFYLARNALLSIKLVNKLFTIMFYTGVVIGVWGIIQAYILGDIFLINLGYEASNGRLHSSFYIAMFLFQRAVGTFASPNTFGIYLQMCIMLGVYLNFNGLIKNIIIYYSCNIIMVCAMLYSFSRSSILALLFSMILFTLIIYDVKKCIVIISKFIISLSFVFIIIFVFNKDVIEPFITHAINTITLQDPSTVGHLDSLNDSISFASKNPFGIGLGKTGPRASARSGVFINSENSFFILLFDLGIFGLFLYILLLLLFIVYLHTKIKYYLYTDTKSLYVVIFSIFVGQIFVWNLLPYIVELETTLILFFLLGLGFNNHIGAKEYA